MEHRCTLKVRSYECDSYAHVNNAVYLNYLEVARHEYLRDVGLSVAELRAAGFFLVIAEITIRYRAPALAEDVLHIVTKPVKRSRLTGVLDQRILRDEVIVVDAQVKWVCVGTDGKLTPLPPAFEREGLNP